MVEHVVAQSCLADGVFHGVAVEVHDTLPRSIKPALRSHGIFERSKQLTKRYGANNARDLAILIERSGDLFRPLDGANVDRGAMGDALIMDAGKGILESVACCIIALGGRADETSNGRKHDEEVGCFR